MAVVMAQHTPRIYFATRSGGDPELAITEANWWRHEKVYGHELQPEVRTQIYDATWIFLAFSDFEQLAQPISIVRKRIKKIENAASKLQNAILENPEGVRSDAAVYADYLISQNLRDTRIIGKLKVLGSVMVSVAEACRSALQQLETETKHGPRKGTTWQRWVHKLGSIAAEHRLPAEARKDTDKTDQLSPFVELVDALQMCLPRECRRVPSALAKAIHDARNELSGRKTSRRLSNKSRH
jgi:hypothetical protein